MRVNINNGMQSNFLAIRHNNQGFNKNNFVIKNSEQQEQKDTVSISPLGKANSLIESLIKHKQNITENKNELIGKTLEKGEDMDSIKSQLECFEEQLRNIDVQIAQITSEQLVQQAESQKEIAYKKPKAEEEAKNERLNSIVNLASNISQVQAVSSLKNKVDGESSVLKMEAKLDGSRGRVAATKKERIVDLQKQSANMSTRIKEELIEVSEKISEINDYDLNEPEKAETAEIN